MIIEILDLGAPTDAKRSRRKHRNPKGGGWGAELRASLRRRGKGCGRRLIVNARAETRAAAAAAARPPVQAYCTYNFTT